MNTRKLLLTISLLANASLSFAMESVSAKASDFAKATTDKTSDKEKEEKPYEYSKKRMRSNSQENEISAFTSPQPVKQQKTQRQILEEINQAESKCEAERIKAKEIEERIRSKKPGSLRVSNKRPLKAKVFQHAGKRPFKRRKAEMQPAFYYMAKSNHEETSDKLVDTTESAQEDIENDYQLFNSKDDIEKENKEEIEWELPPLSPEFRQFLPVLPDLEEQSGQSVVEKKTSPQSSNQKRRLTIRLGEKLIASPVKTIYNVRMLTLEYVINRLEEISSEEEKASLLLALLNKGNYYTIINLFKEITLNDKKLLVTQIPKMNNRWSSNKSLVNDLLTKICKAGKKTSKITLVEQLLNLGANPVFKNEYLGKYGPLDHAFRMPQEKPNEVEERKKVIDLLLNKAKKEKKTIESNSLLQAATARTSESIEVQFNRCKEIIITHKLKPNLNNLNCVIAQGRSWKIKSLITQQAQWNTKEIFEQFILKNRLQNSDGSNDLLVCASLLPRLIEQQLNSKDTNKSAFLSSKQIVAFLVSMTKPKLDKSLQVNFVAQLDISLDKVMRLFTHKDFHVCAMPQLLRFKDCIISACTTHKILEEEHAEEQFNAFHHAILKLSEQDEINQEDNIIKRIDMLPNNNIFKLLFVTNNPDLYDHDMNLIN